MLMTQKRKANILFVEDNISDIEITKEAILDKALSNKIITVRDGEAALDYLYKRPPYEEKPIPDLILLDINLPKISGLEVLKQIKLDENLQHIPTIMLTSSMDEADIITSYKFHANCYLHKPVTVEEFAMTVQIFEQFWADFAILPPQNIQ